MLNGTYEIDCNELGRRAKAVREQKQMSQSDVAVEIGASQGWVSLLELGKVNLLGADHLKRAKDLVKVLDFSIPYVGKPKQEDPAPIATPEPPKAAQPLSLPSKVAPEPQPAPVPLQKAPDAELEAIRACSEAMEKLRDKEACQRVLGYVRARYGLPRLPDFKP